MTKAEEENVITELERIFPYHLHIIGGKQLTFEEWQINNEPHQWILASKINNIELYDDVSYGCLLLIKNGKINAHGKGFVISHDNEYVGIDESYNGLRTSTLYRRCINEIKPEKNGS